MPAPCAAAIAAEPPENSSPVGHTLNIDEPHAGLLIAAGSLWVSETASATVPQVGFAFICGEIGFTQGAIDLATVELRFGHDESAKRLAATELAAAVALKANLVAELRAHVR